MSPAWGDASIWEQALQKWELREERGSTAAAQGGGCCAVTHRLASAARRAEPGTGIVALEVNVVSATALPCPCPCPSCCWNTAALPASNKPPQKGAPWPQGPILVTFSSFFAPKRPRDAFLPPEIVTLSPDLELSRNYVH